jgi:protein-L-isoaspartate(D-aspartate) O-methyltransferase
MRSIASILVAVAALSCPKRDDTKTSTSASRAPDSHAPPAASTSPAGEAREAPAPRLGEREALVALLREEGIANERVLSAIRRVPRHAFVPETESGRAYSNQPLPIGYGQTISQPFIVAAMTEAADPRATDKCLEIGTGSGYQAAVLAELCDKVYSIEYLEPLAQFAERNLRRAGYDAAKVILRTGDGYRGWPEAAPFDVVLVTAAPESVPRPLLDQLAARGRLVIPVGPNRGAQKLELWVRSSEAGADFFQKTLMSVRFVPFVGEAERRQ